jgi:hypothetical protein
VGEVHSCECDCSVPECGPLRLPRPCINSLPSLGGELTLIFGMPYFYLSRRPSPSYSQFVLSMTVCAGHILKAEPVCEGSPSWL